MPVIIRRTGKDGQLSFRARMHFFTMGTWLSTYQHNC